MRRVLVLLTAVAALTALVAVPAQARSRAPCLGPGKGGPTCYFWNAKVIAIEDGDTLEVKIDGVRHHDNIRVTAIQAMEQSVYSKTPSRRRGECHALEATARFEKLVKNSHKRIKLSAQNPKSKSLGRLRRTVWVRYKGKWTSVGTILLREGHVLWLPIGSSDEWARNATYDQLGQEARQAGKNLWNPTYCGNGPQQDVPLRMWINWDPMGVDEQEIHAEWAKIRNESTTTTLSLGGWWFRSADYPRLHIPKGTTLGPGKTLTIYTDHGTNTNSSLFWNYNKPQWGNPVDKTHQGDAGYLFDPKGDLRLVAQYPCLVACGDPLDGKVGLHVDPGRGGREFSELTNNSGGDVDLFTYGIRAQGYFYTFEDNAVLHPGETMRVYVDGDPADDTRLTRYSGVDKLEFPNPGGFATFENWQGRRIACDAWGSGHC